MDTTNFKLEEVFDSAVNIVRNLPKEGPIKPSDALKLKFYAYFKQATHGPNDTPKPRFYQIVEAYKWDAWRELGDMTKKDAMLNYIRELKQIMDTIPKEHTDSEESRRFEDILGKKFYDYWFGQWHAGGNRELIVPSLPEGTRVQTGESCATSGNDNQNDSSSGSSVSMLEDTQSAGGDGYKTPTSTTHNIANQMSDQFALAILRLQHGLDETRKHMNHIESQLKSNMDCLKRLENQTYTKQPLESGNGGKDRGGRSSSSPCRATNMITLLDKRRGRTTR